MKTCWPVEIVGVVPAVVTAALVTAVEGVEEDVEATSAVVTAAVVTLSLIHI